MKTALTLAALLALSLSTSAFARGGGGGHSGYSSHSSSHSYSSPSYTSGSTGDHYVSGHTRSDGTYVPGHHATNPNATRNDNYSTRSNVNPYTGKEGTKPRDGEY